MRAEILQSLGEKTPEEQAILRGAALDRRGYTDHTEFIINRRKLTSDGYGIAMRPHTRFVRFPEHRHDYIEMMYLVQGSITHLVEGRSLCLEAGDLLVFGRHTSHEILPAGEGDLGVNFLMLPTVFDETLHLLRRRNAMTDFLSDTLQSEHKGQYLHFRTSGLPELENLFENLIYSLMGEGNELTDRVTLALIFLHLSEHMEQLQAGSSLSYDDVLMRFLLQSISNHYQTVRLGELAAQMRMSPSALSMYLKRNTGFTFTQLLQQKRFSVACGYLETTKISVQEIAALVGYENNSYFHRCFLKTYGMSPKEYRLMKQREG